MYSQLETLVDSKINELPSPEFVKLIKLYNDTDYGDLETTNGEIIKYIRLIGGRTIGKTGILLYLGNDYNNPIAIIDI